MAHLPAADVPDDGLRRPQALIGGEGARTAAIGECMLELSTPTPGLPTTLQLGYGGDTLNTTVYMARLGIAVEYVTALGDDAYSAWMLEGWQAEGVGTELVTRVPGRVPGLYIISTDASGERSFSYWRSAAPARERFDDPAQVARIQQRLSECRLIYLSGITLSLYAEAARERIFTMLAELRQGGTQVAFDSNYRPASWPDSAAAHEVIARAWSCTDLALPTFEDEQALFGDARPEATLARIASAGAAEIALKLGADGCLFTTNGSKPRKVPAQPVPNPVDTTAAGDSFNAAYLAARLKGAEPEQAARQAHTLAATVIQYPGALIPQEKMPLLT